jgi:caa(3)-type oxidase subunit IV
MSEHVVSLKTNVAVWVALLVLTGVTTGIAFVDLGPLNTIVALVIATCKALLVVLIFMHVKYASDKLVKSGGHFRGVLPLVAAGAEPGGLFDPDALEDGSAGLTANHKGAKVHEEP